MRFVFDRPEIAAAYVTAATGFDYGLPKASIVVVDETGRPSGAFLFNRFTGPGIEMNLAGRGCIHRSAWQAVGDLVYGTLGCVRLAVTTRRSNKRVCKIAPRLGFKFEGIARRFYGEEDGVVFALTREQAVEKGRWRP